MLPAMFELTVRCYARCCCVYAHRADRRCVRLQVWIDVPAGQWRHEFKHNLNRTSYVVACSLFVLDRHMLEG